MNPRLRLFAQDSLDAIQLIKKKNVRRPAGELNDEPSKAHLAGFPIHAKSESNDPVRRIFQDVYQVRATELRPHRLPERIESNRLLLQVFCATTYQIKTRIRRL